MPEFADFFDECFDGWDFFGAGFALATEAIFEGGFLVAAGLAEAGDFKTADAVSDAAVGFFNPVDLRVFEKHFDPPGGAADAGVAWGEGGFEIAAIGGVKLVFATVLGVEPDVDGEFFGVEMAGKQGDGAGVAFWQVEKQVAGGDVAMVAADVIEPDEGEGEGVEAGVAVWCGECGDGLLDTDQQGGGEDGGERVF